MPVAFQKSRVILVSTGIPESVILTRHLVRIDRPDTGHRTLFNIDRRRGFGPEPFDLSRNSPRRGFVRLAIVKDPVDALVVAWQAYANVRSFTRHGELDSLAGAGLPADPDLATFVTRIEEYRKASPLIARRAALQSMCLGPDPKPFHRIFRAEELNDAITYVDKRAGLKKVKSARPVNRPGPAKVRIDQPLADILKAATALEYARLSEFYSFDESPTIRNVFHPSKVLKQPLSVVSPRPAPADPGLTVTTMLKERPEAVRRFVDYYKQAGYGRINIYFDDPADPVMDEYLSDPFVNAIPCGAEFWDGKIRMNALEARQKVCFAHAYARQQSGWMLFVDADEFVWSDRPMHETVAAAPAGQRLIRAFSWEPVWGPGADYHNHFSANMLRSPIWGKGWQPLSQRLHGVNAPLFKRGALSHLAGKYMVRAGLPITRLSTHKVFYDDTYLPKIEERRTFVKTSLIHYDAASFPHWCGKLDRRLVRGHSYGGQSPARIRQVRKYARLDADGREDLFRRLYCLTEEQQALLMHHNLLQKLELF